MATTLALSTAAQARSLLAWLDGLGLPPRALAPLRRDLEAALGLREAAPGRGFALVGLDRARFTAELYHDGGGAIRRVPSVGALLIERLRAAIPLAPPSPDDEGWREFTFDEPLAPAVSGGSEAPAATSPKRRGRPRRADRAQTAPASPPVAPTSPPDHPAPAAGPPPAAAPPEPDEAQLRRLWHALHPQGRRAALGFIAEQLAAQ